MTIWLISDTHFGHTNMYTFTYKDRCGVERRVRERFRDVHEGDAYMRQRWCELVQPSDHVYHLGDVTMERSSNAKEWFVNMMRGLPGHKRLILGNHDHLSMDVYRDAGFQKIKGSHYMSQLLFTHYPVHVAHMPRNCLANVHGHIHQNATPAGPYINMSVEVNAYEPVPLEVVVDRAKKLPKQ